MTYIKINNKNNLVQAEYIQCFNVHCLVLLMLIAPFPHPPLVVPPIINNMNFLQSGCILLPCAAGRCEALLSSCLSPCHPSCERGEWLEKDGRLRHSGMTLTMSGRVCWGHRTECLQRCVLPSSQTGIQLPAETSPPSFIYSPERSASLAFGM